MMNVHQSSHKHNTSTPSAVPPTDARQPLILAVKAKLLLKSSIVSSMPRKVISNRFYLEDGGTFYNRYGEINCILVSKRLLDIKSNLYVLQNYTLCKLRLSFQCVKELIRAILGPYVL